MITSENSLFLELHDTYNDGSPFTRQIWIFWSRIPENRNVEINVFCLLGQNLKWQTAVYRMLYFWFEKNFDQNFDF